MPAMGMGNGRHGSSSNQQLRCSASDILDFFARRFS